MAKKTVHARVIYDWDKSSWSGSVYYPNDDYKSYDLLGFSNKGAAIVWVEYFLWTGLPMKARKFSIIRTGYVASAILQVPFIAFVDVSKVTDDAPEDVCRTFLLHGTLGGDVGPNLDIEKKKKPTETSKP